MKPIVIGKIDLSTGKLVNVRKPIFYKGEIIFPKDIQESIT